MQKVIYEVGTKTDLELSIGEDFASLKEAKQHALYMAAKRSEKRVRYASGSLEWNCAGGWAEPVCVRRRAYSETSFGSKVIDRKSRVVFTAPSA